MQTERHWPDRPSPTRHRYGRVMGPRTERAMESYRPWWLADMARTGCNVNEAMRRFPMKWQAGTRTGMYGSPRLRPAPPAWGSAHRSWKKSDYLV